MPGWHLSNSARPVFNPSSAMFALPLLLQFLPQRCIRILSAPYRGVGKIRTFVPPLALTAAMIFSPGCKPNYYDTTITDAKVEAIAKRTEIQGHEWAKTELRKILKSEPSHWGAIVLLSNLLIKDDPKNPETLKLVRQAKVSHLPPSQRLQATYGLGEIFARHDQWNELLRLTEETVNASSKEKWPEAESHYAKNFHLEARLGMISQESEKVGQAVTLAKLKEFVEQNPTFTTGRTGYAVFLREAGRYQDAIEQFQMVLNDAPGINWTSCRAKMGLAKTYLAHGNLAEAKKLARKAREMGAQLNAPVEFMDQHLKPIETAQ